MIVGVLPYLLRTISCIVISVDVGVLGLAYYQGSTDSAGLPHGIEARNMAEAMDVLCHEGKGDDQPAQLGPHSSLEIDRRNRRLSSPLRLSRCSRG